MRRTTLTLRLATAALLALLVGAPAAAAAAPPDRWFGMNVNRVFNDRFEDGDRVARELPRLAASGVRVARSDALWGAVEQLPPDEEGHRYDWAFTDFVAGSLARHGMRWLPIVDYATWWSSSYPDEHHHAPPHHHADYAAYAGALTERYGRGGDFWAENPELPYLPVTAYEIWNEPNLTWAWRPAPDPARFIDLYLEARTAIRAADPQADAVVGGITPDEPFVRAMYAARPEAREQIDGFGFHPYAHTAEGVLRFVRRMRGLLESLGEGDVPLWITEVGWRTSGVSTAISDETRAARLATVADALAHSDCEIAGFFPYTWSTPEADPAEGEDWYGMLHPDGRPSATSVAYAEVIRRRGDPPSTAAERTRVCHPPDTDGDGAVDPDDGDDDGDGVADARDSFPLDAKETRDLDADGVGDNGDPDDDGDGTDDARDAFPRDRLEWLDSDADGTGNEADGDDDGDGVADGFEIMLGTSLTDLDSDDDGRGDAEERGTHPARADSDRDGLPDGLEAGLVRGVISKLPGLAATDGRRFRRDRDPRSKTYATRKDSDRDGLSDGREDADRDGRRDRGETDPRRRDTDGDGIPDRRERRRR